VSEHARDLTFTERKKLGYLVSVYQTVYDCWTYSKSQQFDDFESAADEAGWIFDWTPVIRECFPDVLVVMSGSDRRIRQFPVFVVVPGAGEWFEIHSNPEQLEQLRAVAVLPSRDGSGFGNPLEELRKMISSLPTDRRGEAEKHRRALERIITPKA
jgi:hypothetical protein